MLGMLITHGDLAIQACSCSIVCMHGVLGRTPYLSSYTMYVWTYHRLSGGDDDEMTRMAVRWIAVNFQHTLEQDSHPPCPL